mgnify:CR=1 FL=1
MRSPLTVSTPAAVRRQIDQGTPDPIYLIVGDDDGVVVVPSWYAEECIDWVEEHEGAEALVYEALGAIGGQQLAPEARADGAGLAARAEQRRHPPALDDVDRAA